MMNSLLALYYLSCNSMTAVHEHGHGVSASSGEDRRTVFEDVTARYLVRRSLVVRHSELPLYGIIRCIAVNWLQAIIGVMFLSFLCGAKCPLTCIAVILLPWPVRGLIWSAYSVSVQGTSVLAADCSWSSRS